MTDKSYYYVVERRPTHDDYEYYKQMEEEQDADLRVSR